MRYIRTKDGIYQVTYDGLCFKVAKSQTMLMLVEHKNEKGKIEYEEITTHKTLSMGKYHFKKHIIKQADTIEELCDCFIAIGEKGTICAFKTFNELKQYYYTIPNEKLVEKYGAIHIADKGLIYVAKMNNEGVLELL